MIIANSSGNGITAPLDASYYKGQGMRQGIEREYLVFYAMQRIDEWKQSEVASTMKERDYKDATDLIARERERESGCAVPAVRRLTPTECERLQQLPDGWTDIGEWVDSKGKVRQTTDAARYKAIGNAMALPYWKVLARKIAAQYDRDITVGSLFDGIGCFPLAFKMAAGAETRWTSEIDDYCTAVTEKHFGNEDKGIEGDVNKYL